MFTASSTSASKGTRQSVGNSSSARLHHKGRIMSGRLLLELLTGKIQVKTPYLGYNFISQEDGAEILDENSRQGCLRDG